MPGAQVDVTIRDKEVQALLSHIVRRVGDLQPAMALIGEIVVESVQRNFEEHRAPDGTPWAAVLPAYAAWKTEQGKNPDDILILNRILMGSIHRDSADKDSVVIGTDVEYAAQHQFGDPVKNMPKRPFLGIRDDDWQEITAALSNHILGRSPGL